MIDNDIKKLACHTINNLIYTYSLEDKYKPLKLSQNFKLDYYNSKQKPDGRYLAYYGLEKVESQLTSEQTNLFIATVSLSIIDFGVKHLLEINKTNNLSYLGQILDNLKFANYWGQTRDKLITDKDNLENELIIQKVNLNKDYNSEGGINRLNYLIELYIKVWKA
jgi:hypothetical protein